MTTLSNRLNEWNSDTIRQYVTLPLCHLQQLTNELLVQKTRKFMTKGQRDIRNKGKTFLPYVSLFLCIKGFGSGLSRLGSY